MALLFNKSYYWRPPEGLRKGRIPFFGTEDSTYLVMHPESDVPNAVYWNDGRTKIADDLVEFLDRLAIGNNGESGSAAVSLDNRNSETT